MCVPFQIFRRSVSTPSDSHPLRCRNRRFAFDTGRGNAPTDRRESRVDDQSFGDGAGAGAASHRGVDLAGVEQRVDTGTAIVRYSVDFIEARALYV